MQYLVQIWVKRQEQLRSITRNIGIGPGSHWLLQNTNNWQRRPETEMQGGRPISETERENKMYTGGWPGLVCVAPWLLAGKATNVHTHTFTETGPQAITRSLPHGGPPSTGTSVALLDCKQKAFTQTHMSKAFRPGSHRSQWLLLKSYKIYKIYKTAVSLWENRSDLVEIFTQKPQLLMFTQNSLKCSHMHKITQNP